MSDLYHIELTMIALAALYFVHEDDWWAVFSVMIYFMAVRFLR